MANEFIDPNWLRSDQFGYVQKKYCPVSIRIDKSGNVTPSATLEQIIYENEGSTFNSVKISVIICILKGS